MPVRSDGLAGAGPVASGVAAALALALPADRLLRDRLPHPHVPRVQQQAGPPQADEPARPEVAMAGHVPDEDQRAVEDHERGGVHTEVTAGRETLDGQVAGG